MSRTISHVTVIGAGTMGAAIAGHLANAGVSSHLLDIAPTELTPEEEANGLTLKDRAVRNRIVQAGFERMTQARPASLYRPEEAELIILGNVEDDLEAAAAQSDWIIEAIVERPGPKQELMARLDAIAPADAIISTNTSGIPIHIISASCSKDFQRRFLGTHFFNPPRYLRLLELIPGQETDPAIVADMKAFAEKRLGKGVVIAKDMPNFVGNRMFSYIMSSLLEFAVANDYTVEEVDRLTGTLIGRPKTATFRLLDVVGIDVAALVGEHLYDMIPDDEDRDTLRGPLGTEVLMTLLQNGFLGSKSGQGFYKTVVDRKGGKSFWGLDLQAASEGEVDYMQPARTSWPSVDAVRNVPLPERLRGLVASHPTGEDGEESEDEAGSLIWHTLSQTLAYASKRLPEIADSPKDIDNAMKWGFGWEMGPFETWEALGVADTTQRMAEEGLTVAPWVQEMLGKGHNSFYLSEEASGPGAGAAPMQVYSPQTGRYESVDDGDRVVSIAALKRGQGVLAGNSSASLLYMGDGVLLLEFHTKMNALDLDIGPIADAAIERLHGDATGLVIGNQGGNFSAGANLLLIGALAQSGDLDKLDEAIRALQQMILQLRRAPKPVVAAPYQMALGGGAEVTMCADRIVAHAELYIGQVEVGVGLIPAAGGCKELIRRLVSPHMKMQNADPASHLQKVFELVALAKVSTSAAEARQMGFLGPRDLVVMNADHLLAEAKAEVLRMAEEGYRPPDVTGNIYAAGRDYLANLRVGIHMMREARYITAHEAIIADQLAYVLCGGELSQPAWMDEQYFLDLEREAFKTLCGYPKSHERIWHMLKNGKPLRN
ncbi:MAG: 3-hydroxyacyl-CoA dehydrogenase/enoyl-CoA hydratase family protein [Caldilineaceae bacterium SB0668_bin_21]|nr:3-hydroxyacyl-CoA dehydrogenase/enoyl-CoA hydratase family protein [Caldilineaceae bacterium SB0668_bin_21]MYC21207.1 3-hydroxyacyl-CoA dehydrogenase/enoyl-CoA hydratase family protein [Caldilineaceae bacterium SB0662_bin_25]